MYYGVENQLRSLNYNTHNLAKHFCHIRGNINKTRHAAKSKLHENSFLVQLPFNTCL